MSCWQIPFCCYWSSISQVTSLGEIQLALYVSLYMNCENITASRLAPHIECSVTVYDDIILLYIKYFFIQK